MNVLQDLVYPVVDDFQSQIERPLAKAPETVLVGPGATLDSLLFVSFLLAIEESIEAKLGKKITLAGEKAMSMKQSPFRSMSTLATFIEGEIDLAG